jgi:hypothetical protein
MFVEFVILEAFVAGAIATANYCKLSISGSIGLLLFFEGKEIQRNQNNILGAPASSIHI